MKTDPADATRDRPIATTAGADIQPAGTDAPITRRTRKRNERRDRVFHAAIALFVEQGYDATSMEEIAIGAGLARTTVFNHYPRKVLFLEDWTLRRRQRASQAFADAALRDGTLREHLWRYLAELALLNEETRVETVAIMPPAVRSTGILIDPPLGRALAEIVAAASGETRCSTDPELIGRLIALGYFSAICRWIETEPAPFDLPDELAKLLDAVLDGALTQRARQLQT